MAGSLRQAESEDRETLRRLLADYLREFDGSTEPYIYFDAYWEESERVPFLIDADGAAVGLCLVRALGDRWQIAEFSVVPERRRNGIGRAAVDVLAERARRAGASELEAKVRPDKREALAFWLATGFEVVSAPDSIVTRRKL
jgi:ribosomal protein S18 acetylase RimI-like enzyme